MRKGKERVLEVVEKNEGNLDGVWKVVEVDDVLMGEIRNEMDFTIDKKAVVFYAWEWIEGCW